MELRGEFAGDTAVASSGWSVENFQWLLEKADVSLKQLSDGTGIKESSLKMYKYGNSIPGVDPLVKIADYFRVPVDFLLGRCNARENGEIFENYEDYFKVLRDAALDTYLVNKYAKDDSLTTDYVSIYPYNLIEAIFMAHENICYEFCEDGLNEALSRLSEREQRCMDMRFRQEMTLVEIAEEEQIGSERVRQIIAKGCRKLRHPANLQLIQHGTLGVKRKRELDEKERHLRGKEIELKEMQTALLELAKSLGVTKEATKDASGVDRNLEELDLSVRAENSLKRAGCKTIRDVMEVTESGKLLSVRNMGVQTAKEVLKKLQNRYGLDCFNLYSL